ncbi:MAG: FeoA family protein [Gemmataceae bacterium]
MLPLDMLKTGEWADVADVEGDPAWVRRLAELGLRAGTRLCVVQPGSPCLVQLSGCKVCLRGGESSQIFVTPAGGPVGP